MGLLDTLIGEMTGKSEQAGGQDPLAGALSSLLAKNGGLQGLMTRFSHGGLGDVFSSWVGMGQNKAVDPAQLQNVLGSHQVKDLAAQLGIHPSQASGLLAEF